MPTRSTSVRFGADISGYMAGLRRMEQQTKDFGQRVGATATKHKADWDKIGNTMLVAGGVMAAGMGVAVKSAMDFDKAMSGVGAVADATGSQMEKLRAAAIKAGADTAFSASEAAKAESELAKAGVSVDDILNGGLIGSMNLAAAGQIDLGNAATISAQAMNIFSLKGKDVGHIADVLAAAANKSATDVGTLGQALQQGGLLAAQTGLSFEATVGTLAAFSDSALNGSDAGTSLKTMLQRLTPQSKEAAEKMEQLGFSAYDAKGNFVGMPELAGRMQAAFGDMTPEARNAALAVIFGSDAVRGANVLLKQGETGIRQYIKAVDDQGAAGRMAGKQMDNLAGDVEQLRGSLETLFIKTGSSGTSFFRGLTQGATGVINFFAGLPKPIQETAFAVGAVTTALLLAGGATIKAVAFYKELSAALTAVGLSAKGTAASLKILGGALAVVGTAFAAVEIGKYTGGASVATTQSEKLAKSLGGLADNGKLAGQAMQIFKEDRGAIWGEEKVVTATEALKRFSNEMEGAFGHSLNDKLGRWTDFGRTTGRATKTLEQLDGALAAMVESGHGQQAAKVLDRLIHAVPPELQDEIRAKFVKYAGALDTVQTKAKLAKQLGLDPAALGLENTGTKSAQAKPKVDAFGNVLQDAEGKATDAKTALDNLANSILGLTDTTLAASNSEIDLRNAIRDAEKAARGFIKANGQSTKAFDLNTKAGLANQQQFNRVAQAEYSHVAALVRDHRSTKEIVGAMKQANARLHDLALRFTGSEKAADRMTRQFGYTKGEIDDARRSSEKLTGALKDVDKQHPNPKVDVRTEQAHAELDRWRRSMENLHGRTVSVNAEFMAKYGSGTVRWIQQHATGGPVAGPGTATSDSIPALLSNGEHVLTAREVQAAGGHSAVMAYRKSLLAHGVQRRAFGGPISSGSYPAMFADVNRYTDDYIRQVGPPIVHQMMQALGATGIGGPHVDGGWRQLWHMIDSRFSDAILTSAYRPGATVAGFPGVLSRHGMGKAIDIAPDMDIWRWLVPQKDRFFELLGPWGMWRKGQPWHNPITAANHKDHIHISAYANGTMSARPGWAWVGERGPELVRFRGGERVLSNQQSQAQSSGPTFNTTINAPSDDAQAIWREFNYEFRRQTLAGVYA